MVQVGTARAPQSHCEKEKETQEERKYNNMTADEWKGAEEYSKC